LRARGGLSRIEGEDLCFDVPETDRLFREAYHRPLEPDIVAELIKRTEGWAALLTLVRTSLEDKDAPETRALVAQLSATRGDLYDFLAEEVLETLSPSLQRFLTRVSVLVSVDAETGSLVDGRPAAELVPLITEAETLGLLTRPDRESPHRFHPLVRDFLVARLREEVGDAAVREMHIRVAAFLEPHDWFGATWHFREAADVANAARVLDSAVSEILAAGTFEMAAQFLDGSTGSPDRPAAQLLRSRVELERGHYERALDLAVLASSTAQPEFAGTALLNLAFLRSILGYGEDFVVLAEEALRGILPADEADLAQAAIAVAGSQVEGNLEEVSELLEGLASRQSQRGQKRYAAVSRLNRAWVLIWLDRIEDAFASAATAEVEFGKSARSVYRVGAMMARAHALARLGRWADAREVISQALDTASDLARDEAAIEGGSLHVDFGNLEDAESVLASRGSAAPRPEYASVQALPLAGLALRRDDFGSAQEIATSLEEGHYRDVAGRLRIQLLRSRVFVARNDPKASSAIDELMRLGSVQRSPIGIHCASVLSSVYSGTGLSGALEAIPPQSSYIMSMLAEEIARSLPTLTGSARDAVRWEAAQRPERWLSALWLAVARGPGAAIAATALIAEFGTPRDAARLRELAKGDKQLRSSAVLATRRLALPVLIDDLGSVAIHLGGERVRDRLRRKVVGLLCFLVTRPGMSATRDEALEALWSDLGPDTAGNSLHQTIYFLRRVFEPDYREGLSAGYVGFDGDVVSLDPELIDSTSRRTWEFVGRDRRPTVAGAEELLGTYRAKYALDFAYEDWAAPYRENLHASVLSFVEGALGLALATGDADAAIRIARALLHVDPDADTVELLLLRAYKRSGRTAAAAEQYAHYSSMLREDLGVEPPALEDV
jgi:DNA-binding SARP family transcriptional activator/tetratricopeptide (TPR) repeat protein